MIGATMSDDWDDDDEDEIPSEWAGDAHALRRAADETRVSMEEADRAMRLLRDRPLALAIAAEAPAGPDRVALAVGVGELPPHVIVGRAEGGYNATVLWRNMVPIAGTPIVAFDRVTMHVERADLQAERTMRAQALWKDRAGVRHLLARCDDAGARLAREDFAELAALAPILKRFPPSIEHKLIAFWNRFHAVGHYTLLACVRGKDSFAHLARAAVAPRLAATGFEPYRNLYFQHAQLGQGYVVLRVLAGLARAGDAAVPMLERVIAEAKGHVRWLLGAYGLIAIGRRRTRLREELAGKLAVANMPAFMRDSADASGAAETLQMFMEATWAEPGADEDVEEANMRRLAEALVLGVDGEASLLVKGDALSMARLAAMPCNFHRVNQDVASLSLAVALCAEVSPEVLYFPAAHTALAPAYDPVLAREYAYIVPSPSAPVRAVEKPGRNEVCSCGSGKKWKKCHGAN